MHKKIALISVAVILAAVAVAVIWIFLRPMTEADAKGGDDEAWKLEAVRGSWASQDERYGLTIDGFDFIMKIDGVYRLVSSFHFDPSGQAEEPGARFELALAPGGGVCFNEDGIVPCEMLELWHEDGSLYVSFVPGTQGEDGGPVRLSRIQSFDSNASIFRSP